jgi:hypothetical protein
MMGIVDASRQLFTKFVLLVQPSQDSVELDRIGQQLANHFQTLSGRLEAPALPTLRQRESSNEATFSLPLIFLSVLVASLAISPQLLGYVTGKRGTWLCWDRDYIQVIGLQCPTSSTCRGLHVAHRQG